MQTSKDTSNIYSYSSLRSFLKAHAEDQKAKNATWSYGMWARRLGLKGTASLTMIINGQRNAGPQMVQAFTEYFKFSDKEKKYFENLANLEKVDKDSSLQYLVLQELRRLSPLKNFKIFDENMFEVISNWYHLAIKHLVRMGINEPSEIHARLHFEVTEKQVKSALQNLEKVGLIERNQRNEFQLSNGNLVTNDDVPSEAIKRYHEQSLENSKKAVREIELALREFQSLTLVMDEKRLDQAKEMIRSFVNEFSKSNDSNHGNQVYQLNVQMFPLTKTKKEPKESL